jgi:hypothetical protein
VGAARLPYSNNLEPIEVIRDDGKIEGVDPTVAAFTGTIEARFSWTAPCRSRGSTPGRRRRRRFA